MQLSLKNFVKTVSSNDRIFLVFLSAVLFVSIPITVYAVLQAGGFRIFATHQDCFDVNDDFIVTQADGDVILNHIAFGGGYVSKYDVDHDGDVDSLDAFHVLTHEGEICSPKISFSASPNTINVGGISRLKWSTKHSSLVSITPTVGAVSLSGSRNVSPASTTTYTLEAANPYVKLRSRVTVTVVSIGTPQPEPGLESSSEPTSTIQADGLVATAPKTLQLLKLNISAPHLIKKTEIPIVIGGREKKIEISGGTRVYSYGVSKDKFRLGRRLTIVIGGNKVLKKTFRFTPKKETVTIKIGGLAFGDITGDNKINKEDKIFLLDSIAKQTLRGDLNFDGVTNSLDFAILLVNFGRKGSL